jgi:phosphohistidine phosphatase
MHLFVIRHAIAENARIGQDDASRRLAPEGERKFRGVVRGIRKLRWRFDRVLTSPWTRASQTAELLAPVSDSDPIATDLLCAKPRPELLALIAENAATVPRHATAVVGHEPWLSELVATLAYADPTLGDGLLFKKGGLVWLEGTPIASGMKLRAIIPPKVLRAVR